MKHKYAAKIFSLLLAVALCATASAVPAFAYAEDTAANEVRARQIGTVVTEGDDLNVRDGAGLEYEVFAQLPNGTMVEVIGTDGDWYKIHLAERDGYVHSDYLAVVAEADVGNAALSDEALEHLASLLENGGGAALTVEGNLALLDDLGGADGKQIVTVETRDGHVFYLIIDRDSAEGQSVHFLNQVDEADLMPLTEDAAVETLVERLWISSMEDSAIREGFSNLRPGSEYDSLYYSALCRQKADWLVGINATRLFSVLYHRTLNVGRVQTPTLAMLAERDGKIVLFKKEKYHHVRLNVNGIEAVSEKFTDLAQAEKVKAACTDTPIRCVSVQREQKKEQPPKLYDLTTLQREANRIFGYTAKQTLDYAQSLYEKKLLTYPRTDSRYLTSDMAETASCVTHLAAKVPPFDKCSSFYPLVELMVSDKDVTDHHAIIPTMELEKADIKLLPVGERNLLLLVCCKLLCAAASPYEYETITATFDCGGYTFTAKGKRVLAEGWREIDRIFRSSLKEKPEDTEDNMTIPNFTEGQTFENAAVTVTEHFTTPPKPYTEDTLLSAMENAGKADIPDEAERKGMGTPATRAAIIEKLVSAGFIERKGKNLIPTKAGINLVLVLPEPLTSPMLTAEWEQKLTEIARANADPNTFMDGIRVMVQEVVSTYSHISEDGQKLFAPEKEVIGTCPRCGKPVYEGKKNFACSDRSCSFVLWKNDRFWTSRKKELTKKMAADLLKKGHTNVKGMWSEKKGASYDATVILDDTGEKFIHFKLEFPKNKRN